MVADRVLWAIGSAVGCWVGGVVWERVLDVTGLSVGAGCTLGASAVGWVAFVNNLGAGCVASRCFVYLFLSTADGGTSLVGAFGAGWEGVVVGGWTPLQALVAPCRD